MSEVSIAVHGGAGRLAKRKTQYPGRRVYEQGVAEAVEAGRRVLLSGGSATRAVREAVVVLERLEVFNAGRGAALCKDGSIELSASIMNGKDRSVGGVVGCRRARHPVLVADAVRGHRHCVLFGLEADAYALERGLETVEPEYFYTERRRKQWEKMRGQEDSVLDHSDTEETQGTVGAVARDRRGNLAAATSTGGLVNQAPGRVGDTPIVGAGTWADNAVAAISATGKGDAFLRVSFVRRVADLVELAGLSGQGAGVRALEEVATVGGVGGCIGITAGGEVFLPFNSANMVRGWALEREPVGFAMALEDWTVLAP